MSSAPCVWLLSMQYAAGCEADCVNIAVFSTEAALDAYAALHDPASREGASVGHIHAEDDFFFPIFRKQSMPLNMASDRIGQPGIPIISAKYEALQASWKARRH